MRLKVGIIGAGSISHRHMAAYVENQRVQSVCIADPSQQAREKFAEKFVIESSTDNYENLLEDKSIDLVDICTPPYFHHKMTIDALEAGKDVICEKPISMTLEEADDMIKTARKLNRRLFIEMNQRFMPYHQKTKELIESGVIGKPFMAVFNIAGNELPKMNDPDNWKGSWDMAGGGAMMDTGYHAVYMMEHFFGRPESVCAIAKRLVVPHENKADDNTAAVIEFDGVLGTISVSYSVTSERWSEERHIYGTEGSLHIADVPINPLVFISDNNSEIVPVDHPPNVHPHAFSIKQCLDYYVDCILDDKESEVTPEEARYALETTLAMYRSSERGERIHFQRKRHSRRLPWA